jgi:hypothetical protein
MTPRRLNARSFAACRRGAACSGEAGRDMPFIDKFRKLLRRHTGDIDDRVSKDAKSAKAHLKERLDAHTEEIEQDLIAQMERKVVEQRKRFDQLEPTTFDATFEEVPAPLLLTSERPHKGEQQEEPEASASATPPPNATDEPTSEPPAEAGDDPPPRRTARAGRRPRLSGNRAR